MPIYEYSCKKCGEVTELLVFGGEETPECRGYGSKDVVKLMSAHNTSTGSGPTPSDCSCCGSQESCGSPGSCCAAAH